MFARNGSIVPLSGAGSLELHYFPKLGAEFFIYEETAGDYSQVHAAPAADIMRLEIESKVDREYTWIVHHLDSIKSVASGDTKLSEVQNAAELRSRSWYYDHVRKDLYVRDHVTAGQDHIINLSF